MLGGYYLGQLYLGISGFMQAGELVIQSADHGHSADNITLVQHHTVVVSNTTHSVTSYALDIIENKLLAIASADNILTSDNISLVQQHTLSIADTLHGLISDNTILLQKHTVSVVDSAHSLATDGNILLNQFTLLNQPDTGAFIVTSPEIPVFQHHTLDINSSVHTLFDDISRIINLADYSYYSGVYIKDFSSEGDIDKVNPEYGVVVVNRDADVDALVPVTQDTGTFITEFSTFGRYK
mgnify:CR=1 FL=1